ncbi:MAG: phosphotransferase, partial [Kiritimatiellae bacterium]|nr:phosphotransferase [Kiritimatiellia bacterium]
MKIKKAIVLAAGHGTRLRPFTCATPKPLMPVWGEPMLGRIVAMLREWGVDDIAFNTHCLHEQVKAWADGYRRGATAAGDIVKIKVSYEPEILGTGGVLNPLREWIGDEPFYLVNGDIVVENAPNPLDKVRNFESPSVVGCALVSESGPRTIEVEPESGFVTNWRSQDAGWDGTYTYCGIAVLKPEILKFVKPEGYSSIVSAYEDAMMHGKFVKSVRSREMLWTDAGTIPAYIDLNRDGDDNAFADFPQVKAALEAVGTPNGRVEFLGARGSERVFFRCDKGIIILYDDGNRDENGLYAGHARFLHEKGIPVPEVLADLVPIKTLVLADAGVERKMSLEDYVKVVETLVKFNALGDDPAIPALNLLPGFDDETWTWERNLFRKHCLGTRFGREMPEAVERELKDVAAMLEREPKALVHRDFQSTNVLWKGDDLAFIDFQGMRLGPAAYDLASLVYDPYVSFTEGERHALVALYAKKCGRPEIEKVLPFAAVQRLVQCLGAYGRLASVGQPQFGRHSLPALQNLLDAADRAGLDAVGALAEDLIAEDQRLHKPAGHGHCGCGHH